MENRKSNWIFNKIAFLLIFCLFNSCENFYKVTLYENINNSFIQIDNNYKGICSYYGSKSIEESVITSNDSLNLFFQIEFYNVKDIDKKMINDVVEKQIIDSKHRIKDVIIKIDDDFSGGVSKSKLTINFQLVSIGRISHDELFNEIGSIHLGLLKTKQTNEIFFIKLSNL